MTITIEGNPKEIAALVLELRERQDVEGLEDGSAILAAVIEKINRQTESAPIFR